MGSANFFKSKADSAYKMQIARLRIRMHTGADLGERAGVLDI